MTESITPARTVAARPTPPFRSARGIGVLLKLRTKAEPATRMACITDATTDDPGAPARRYREIPALQSTRVGGDCRGPSASVKGVSNSQSAAGPPRGGEQVTTCAVVGFEARPEERQQPTTADAGRGRWRVCIRRERAGGVGAGRRESRVAPRGTLGAEQEAIPAAPALVPPGIALAHRVRRPYQCPQTLPRAAALPVSRPVRDGTVGRSRRDRE